MKGQNKMISQMLLAGQSPSSGWSVIFLKSRQCSQPITDNFQVILFCSDLKSITEWNHCKSRAIAVHTVVNVCDYSWQNEGLFGRYSQLKRQGHRGRASESHLGLQAWGNQHRGGPWISTGMPRSLFYLTLKALCSSGTGVGEWRQGKKKKKPWHCLVFLRQKGNEISLVQFLLWFS